MDIFTTQFLNGIVDNLLRPQSFLLDTFFPTVINSDKEEINFDVATGSRRIAPFVSPLVEGKLVESLGFTTSTFKPAYVKDKRVFDPNKALKRAIGEAIGGTLTGVDRSRANVVVETTDQVEMLLRRQEVMASEAMRAGTVTVSGEGYDTVIVNYGRDAGHTVVLTGANRWGQTGISPLDDLETWTLAVSKKSGAYPNKVVMDIDAWKQFRADPRVKDILDIRRASPASSAELATNTDTGGMLQATIGSQEIWTYNEWYINDSGTEVPMLPSGTVILGSNRIDGVRHFGAIRDERAGYQAREFFSKSWLQEDPAVRFLMMQSAPLVVPYRPNASFAATVL